MFEMGTYDAEVMQQGFGESKTGTPYFYLMVEPRTYHRSGGEPEAVEYPEARHVYLYLTDKAIENAVRDLRAIGFQGNNFSDLDPSNPEGQSFVGDNVRCWCDHEEYAGKPREKWNLSTGGGVKALDSGKQSQLDKMFGKFLKANPAPAPANAKPAPAAAKRTNAKPAKPARQTVPDDDADEVPF